VELNKNKEVKSNKNTHYTTICCLQQKFQFWKLIPKEVTNHQLIHTTGYLHASNDFTTSQFWPWILLAWIILSITKRWQRYLSSDGETCAVCGGAGSLRAHHHCHYCCCYCCYCSLLSCHSTLASHPANLLLPECTVTTQCEQGCDMLNLKMTLWMK